MEQNRLIGQHNVNAVHITNNRHFPPYQHTYRFSGSSVLPNLSILKCLPQCGSETTRQKDTLHGMI